MRRHADLDREGDRLGAEFGLGRRAGGPGRGGWARTRRPARFVFGLMILTGLACGGVIPAFGETGLAQVIAAMIVGDFTVWAVALMVLPPSGIHERLYLYDAGIVLVADWATEPVVLRWAGLAAVSMTAVDDDDAGHYVSGCELRDRSGTTLMVAGKSFRQAIEQVAVAAELVLAPRLMPAVIEWYDAGQPVTIGPVTIDRGGIGYTGHGRHPEAWRLSWAQVGEIDIRLHGQRMALTADTRHPRCMYLDGAPNAFLVRYLIEHAAAPPVRVTSDRPAWDGEMPPSPAASALPASALPASALPVTGPPVTGQAVSPAGTRSLTRSWRWPSLVAVAILIAECAGGYWYAATRPGPVTVTATPGFVLTVSDTVESLAFTPAGQDVLAADKSGVLTEWDLAAGTSTTLGTGTPYGVYAVAVGPDGTIDAADAGQIDRLNGVTHSLDSPLTVPDAADGPTVVAVSPNGKWVASGDQYGDVFLWTSSAGALRELESYPTGIVQAAAFSPDSATLAVGDDFGNIYLWNVATGTLRGTLTDPDQPTFLPGDQVTGVTSLSFGDRGSLMAASDGNGSVYLWDAGGQSLVATLTGNDPVTTAAMSPDGSVVATGTSGGETYVWDVATGKLVDTIGGGGAAVGAVAFSPGGSQLAIGAGDTVTLWHLNVRSG